MSELLRTREITLIAAPMAGGPSTAELAAALWNAGQFGFLAAGRASADALRQNMRAAAQLPGGMNVGVNLFAPHPRPRYFQQHPEHDVAAELSDRWKPEVDYSFEWDEKFAAVLEAQPLVVNSMFGCFSAEEVRQAHERGIEAWVSVTSPDEARVAEQVGADAVIVQAASAGGHRGSWDQDEKPNTLALPELIAAVAAECTLPLIAAGGLTTPAAVADALSLEQVVAVSCGTAFLLADEAGTSESNRAILREGQLETAATRAFTGRVARGVITGVDEHANASMPPVFPHISPAPERKKEERAWAYCLAGEGVNHCREASAAEIVRHLLSK
ncbi:Nitronate monooxygenase [Corynebacterium ciconiae DSM 44920]|uniref:nitronate monooxygenase n=1 Tax=Corynebacterium ciconiae TaxID=227319 RepID=UPI00036D159F|nr:nitronate monooxygenase [Corynebacterium ciconiae]WKD61610.1 Nitronate monooxygenase [Corynebacterium ciconiae DSM 44920]